AFVKLNEKWGMIDLEGRFLVAPIFVVDDRSIASFRLSRLGSGIGEGLNFYQFRDGLAAVKMDGLWGYIDRDGKWIWRSDWPLQPEGEKDSVTTPTLSTRAPKP
ncbi:MAG: WG repeat-containing protein, partial [bacterium]